MPKHSSIPGSSPNQSTASRARNFFTRATSGNPQPSSSSNPNSNFLGSHSRPYSTASSNSRAQAFPRPDLDPRHDQVPETHYRAYTPRPNGPRSRATSGPSSSGPARPMNNQWFRPPPVHSRTSSFSRPSNTRPAQPPPPPAPAPAPPSLATLLTQSRPSIAALSVGTLKKILWEARVRIPPGVCEKEDLVDRVCAFLEEERRREADNDHDSVWEEYYGDDGIVVTAEEEDDTGAAEPATEGPTGNTNVHLNSNDFVTPDDDHLSTPNLSGRPNTRPTSPQPSPDIFTASSTHAKGKARPSKPTEGGLCVVCQDEEANIAIVDCGHVLLAVYSLCCSLLITAL